ncbi:indole-3-pyruvate decarboxylase [Photobacterium kishitanii]|nr:indole-3-pyruvate decarboxylase [Photobacterium kishitanii]PSW49672.1 indole-3-pyruvate decarboxylase [Photobacterium kishitanii]
MIKAINMKPSLTVVEYLIEALKAINLHHVFGVPGDFAFPINDAICNDSDIEWIGCSNELNASYAADGYARIHGVAALNTTYGPGELSALCGVAGSFAAHLPIIFIAGMPSSSLMATDKLIHHTLGDGKFDTFVKMAAEVTIGNVVLSADNAEVEIQRIIQMALTTKLPVYIGVPEDIAYLKLDNPQPFDFSYAAPNESKNVDALAQKIAMQINEARNPVVMVGEHLRVYNALVSAQTLIETANLPFATMFADKAIIDEAHPNFIGLYDGKVINRAVREVIENSDCVINLGALLTDFNTGAFSAEWPQNTISVYGDRIECDECHYDAVDLVALLDAITVLLKPRTNVDYPCYMGYRPTQVSADSAIDAASLYPRLEQFFKEGDQIIAETGTVSMGLGMAHLPKQASFHNQTLWGSIGWATPAALGAALANPQQRTVLLTGEGSHQLTVQEIGQFHRYHQTPIIFVINNNGYLIERILCKDPMIAYNDLCQWNYTLLPEAFGISDWLVAKVETNAELDKALAMAQTATTGVYIEIVTAVMETPALAANLAAQLNPARGIPVHVMAVED